MRAYYNEISPLAAQGIRNLIAKGLIPDGDVDTRSIADVAADDLVGYRHCHFFAGIAGWALAAKLAGWPDDRELWTGSCPCQPFSTAGAGLGFDDPRHLWPAWFNLIQKCRPRTVFGEQVARKAGLAWLDLVWSQMEASDYAFAPFDLPASSVGAPHPRQRIYFVADADFDGLPRQGAYREPVCSAADAFGEADRFVDAVSRNALPFLCGRHDGLPDAMGALHGFGNAIVPELAAEFMAAHLDAAA